MDAASQIKSAITSELAHFKEVTFAFLFGSAAANRLRADSDVDVAVYDGSAGVMEIEEQRELEYETRLQIALEKAINRNVDLLILNRAPATVCANALLSGHPLLIRDGALYTRYLLAVTNVAFDFLQTEREYREIQSRSRSISEFDRSRLMRILDFIGEELQDTQKFRGATMNRYATDRDFRRNMDRWVEMLINASIDIGKIVLASTQLSIPQTFGQILSELESMPDFSSLQCRLAPLAGLRNLLAHEYLDIRFGRIQVFLGDGAEAIIDLKELTEKWLK